MTVGDLASENSTFFLKSEWAPADDGWPVCTFSRRGDADHAQLIYRPSDFVIYAGTSGKETKNPVHRRRLLSLFTLDTSALLGSKDVIPGENFEPVQAEYPGRWSIAFKMVQAWNFQGFPSASSVLPKTYPNIGHHRGRLLEIEPGERGALLNLAVTLINLQRMWLKHEEIRRMAALIINRKQLSGTVSAERHPIREAPPIAELQQLLLERWNEQQGRCALCRQVIPLPTDKKLLQCSPDRIDSNNPSYAKENVHITHLGCNWAKNDASRDEFMEWLNLIRDA